MEVIKRRQLFFILLAACSWNACRLESVYCVLHSPSEARLFIAVSPFGDAPVDHVVGRLVDREGKTVANRISLGQMQGQIQC